MIEDGVHCSRIDTIEEYKNQSPKGAAPEAAHDPSEKGGEQAEGFQYPDKPVRIEGYSHAAHENDVNRWYLGTAGKQDVDSSKGEEEDAERKACEDLGRYNLREDLFKANFTKKEPIHVDPGRL